MNTKSEQQGRAGLLPWSSLPFKLPPLVSDILRHRLAITPRALNFLAGLACLAALVLTAYWPLLPGNFLMDDHRLVKDDNDLLNGVVNFHTLFFSGDFPLATLGWYLEWRLWGDNPLGYHLVNLFLHTASAVLLWQLLRKLKIPGAWLAAAIFAVHPVCVNSVARIAELKNTLSLPFFLLSFLAYLQYESRALYRPAGSAASQATRWYTLSLIAFVLALFSKTTTVMLPVLLVGCALWQRGVITRRDILHTAPHFILSLGFGLLSIWYQKYQALAHETLAPSTFAERLAQAGWNIWFYLGKALFPVHLSVVYLRWKPDFATVSAYLPGLLIIGIFVLAWWQRRRWGRPILFALGAFLITLFPALGFFDAQYLVKFQVSDHLQYLPLVAAITLLAGFLATIPRHAVVLTLAAIVLVTLTGYSRQRAQVFATQENLMRDTLEKNSTAWAAHNDLAVILAQQRNFPAAEDHFRASLKYNPDNTEAMVNLGQLLIIESRVQEAREQLAAAVRLHPDDPALRARYADALAHSGEPSGAITQLEVALRLKPSPATRLTLAGLLYSTGNFSEAAARYRELLAANPDDHESLNNLAWILATCPDDQVRDGTMAVSYAEHACLLTKFSDPHPLGTLAAAYAEAGRFPEAVMTADFALQQATAARDTQLMAIDRQLMNYYRAGQAWHEPPRSPSR